MECRETDGAQLAHVLAVTENMVGAEVMKLASASILLVRLDPYDVQTHDGEKTAVVHWMLLVMMMQAQAPVSRSA